MAGKMKQSCSLCKKEVLDMDKHIKIHRKCTFCSKEFSHKSAFEKHVLTHSKDKPFKCDTCGGAFKQKITLTRHEKTVHGEFKEFPCLFCGKAFSRESQQRLHLLQHIREKPHDCTLCGESFCEKGALNRHITSHTMEKAFSCKICGKSFRGAESLRYHGTTHLSERPRPYNCTTCKSTFLSKSNLKNHVSNTHARARQLKCHECPKTFNLASSLRRHGMIAHQNAKKNHFCVFCSEGFHEKSKLSAHLISHIQERHFPCGVCNFRFLHSNHRDAHAKRHHEKQRLIPQKCV